MIRQLLEVVANDYEKYKNEDTSWIGDSVKPADIAALRNEATKESSWDTGKIRLTLWNKYTSNEGDVRVFSTPRSDRVVVLSETKQPPPPPKSWIRIFRILSPDTPVRILWFASETQRIPPPVGMPIEPQHINGGYTKQCDAQSVVIYRKEEATRVLIHELLHASCTDPDITVLPQIEADTEAWAEVVLTALAAKGRPNVFKELWSEQANYIMKQCKSLMRYHQVRTKSDYAWRYTTGRFERLRQLGLPFPEEDSIRAVPLKSLRLTLKKLEH